MHLRLIFTATAFFAFGLTAAEPIPRSLPPQGIELSEKDRNEIVAELKLQHEAFGALSKLPLAADVEVFFKAVDLALKHGEFYKPVDARAAVELLRSELAARIKELSKGTASWTQAHGRVVRGFRSKIDDSVQPYGLVIPDDVDLSKPVPLYVWLHGRGDTQTDFHFIRERLTRDGQIKPPGAIVLHAFGRHCLGFKSAGETDVLEAIEHVQQHYKIDPDRIVLMGFSMGGAGAWHIGAHYTDRFVAISPGAGFAETARYQKLRPENFPPKYEQTLWGVYDVPNYARNLFNRTLIAYSGEVDPQMQAARMMEEAFQSHGHKLTHVIGPGMGHKYHPDSLKQILAEIDVAVKRGRPQTPAKVSLQTRTLRYNQMDWVEAEALKEHWQDSRIDAEIVGDRKIKVTTQNIAALRLSPWPSMAGSTIEVNGVPVSVPADFKVPNVLLRHKTTWQFDNFKPLYVKAHGLQGPIDDAFLEPFLVVLPTGRASQPAIQNWVEAELRHFQERWRAVFRGELRMKKDTEVTADDMARFHLIVWGTPQSNSLLNLALWTDQGRSPVFWTEQHIMFGSKSWESSSHVPIFICPNPLQPRKYLVVNSGPTFREAHDRTNSLQNPKLPDWAVIDISVPPSASAPGRIVAADFFDEAWKVKDQKD